MLVSIIVTVWPAVLNLLYTDDQSRVCIKEIPGVEGSDYINASFIEVRRQGVFLLCMHMIITPFQGYSGMKRAYIAAQGIVHFVQGIYSSSATSSATSSLLRLYQDQCRCQWSGSGGWCGSTN